MDVVGWRDQKSIRASGDRYLLSHLATGRI